MRTTRRFRRDIPEIPRSRRFVADVLRSHGARATDAVLLVVSELVTNAVRHGKGEVELRIDLDGSDVRLEVLDDGHAAVALRRDDPSPTAIGGRGLHLVREVSRRWGSGFDPAGRTSVWAEVSAARTDGVTATASA
jgi:anti-sigma regulatory factor (Ser/Thr protein kinase)